MLVVATIFVVALFFNVYVACILMMSLQKIIKKILLCLSWNLRSFPSNLCSCTFTECFEKLFHFLYIRWIYEVFPIKHTIDQENNCLLKSWMNAENTVMWSNFVVGIECTSKLRLYYIKLYWLTLNPNLTWKRTNLVFHCI